MNRNSFKWLGVASTILFAVALSPQPVFCQLSLQVIYPRENLEITPKDSMFIFGSVNDPGARVTVNEEPMKMYSNGAFLGVVPIEPGHFTFRCRAFAGKDTVEVLRNVYIPPYLRTTPRDTVAIDTSYLFPDKDLVLQGGEMLQVVCKGTPGLVASFNIEGVAEKVPMSEKSPWKEFYWGEAVFGEGKPPATPEVAGVYTGVYRLPDDAQIEAAQITFELRGTDGARVTAVAPGRISVRTDTIPSVGELTAEQTVARTGPGLGYQLFLPKGTKVWITGKIGDQYRVRLSDTQNAWVPEENVKRLPSGTQLPFSVISVVRTESFADRVRIKIFLQEKLPFQVEQQTDPEALLVTIYGATSNTDWIRYDFGDPTIREISWTQSARNVYQLRIALGLTQQWGYHPFYQGNNLIVEIKKPPRSLKLKNLLVCVDPGHAPDFGAIGPTGLKEKDANLRLALLVKQRLEKKGATVFLTRSKNHGASLAVRPKMAALLGADILLSIHHNAIPDGVNPFASRGSSTYYYHPQSRPLAVAIQKRLLEKLKLPDFGLYYDNLALCRPPEMPAVLVEPAFIMHPEEEMLINSESYLEKTAEAIVKGIEDFLKQAKH